VLVPKKPFSQLSHRATAGNHMFNTVPHTIGLQVRTALLSRNHPGKVSTGHRKSSCLQRRPISVRPSYAESHFPNCESPHCDLAEVAPKTTQITLQSADKILNYVHALTTARSSVTGHQQGRCDQAVFSNPPRSTVKRLFPSSAASADGNTRLYEYCKPFCEMY
jgi:hypothetical protein